MLKVHTQKIGDITILRLIGQLVNGETDALIKAVSLQSEVSTVVLDFCRVSRIDAGGLGVLLKVREQILSRGVELRLMNVTKLVQQILELTRLNTVFEVTTEKELLNSPVEMGPKDCGEMVSSATN
jgi:anti-sigma B factor antagonist